MIAPTTPDVQSGTGFLIAIGVANIVVMASPVLIALMAAAQLAPEAWRRRASAMVQRLSLSIGVTPKLDEHFFSADSENSTLDLDGVELTSSAASQDGAEVGGQVCTGRLVVCLAVCVGWWVSGWVRAGLHDKHCAHHVSRTDFHAVPARAVSALCIRAGAPHV